MSEDDEYIEKMFAINTAPETPRKRPTKICFGCGLEFSGSGNTCNTTCTREFYE